jgi:(p)ppGpp synthase/HD superfamily hydrolase
VSHTVEVATILAQLRLDTDTLIAGLIHDTRSRSGTWRSGSAPT